ncbi:MAG TPA: hemerythrin domain-containing protein [Acidimicrobiia bacterium]|jgi:hemerythrin superfamily protein
MDAITLLKQDHRTVEELFKKFENSGPRAKKSKRSLVDKMIRELSIHAAIEEQVFYPSVRAEDPEETSEVLEALEEHNVVKWLLSELEGLSPDDERFDAKVSVMMENVRHHVREEEKEMFPQVRKTLERWFLDDLGDRLAIAKKTAPTRPHPRSPDTPPANLVTGAAAAVFDTARDAGKRAVERARAGR